MEASVTGPARAPLVSVCIPTYRGARTIGATIASVLAQTWADFELVVVDDGSPDETAAVVAGFADPRVVYRRNSHNLGPEGNWNRCLELARGTYFKLLPHDDLLHPQCLERQLHVFGDDRSGSIALVFSAREVIGPEGRVLLRHRGWPGARSGPVTQQEVVRACLRHGTNIVGEPGAVLMRRALADKVGGFDATYPYVIDLDYWLRLLEFGRGYYLDDVLASFRVWRGSWSVAIGADQAGQFSALMEATSRRLGLRLAVRERLAAWLMPRMNNLARLLFYRLVVGRG